MKFTKIRLLGLDPLNPKQVDFPIVGALWSDQFVLKDVTGLDPPAGGVSTKRVLGLTEGVYQGRSPQLRELVLTIGLNPSYSTGEVVSDLRETLYDLLQPGGNEVITIQIMDGGTVLVQTSGVVDQIASVLFSRDPVVQITVPCVKTFWSDPTRRDAVAPNAGVVGSPEFNLVNVGKVPVGFEMMYTLDSYDPSAPWSFTLSGKTMVVNYDFAVGDRLRVVVGDGSRQIDRIRSGSGTLNLLPYLSSGSLWPLFMPGNNTLTTIPAAVPHTYVWDFFYYYPKYWGV